MIKYFFPRLTLLRVTERIKLGDQAPIKKQNKTKNLSKHL